MENPKILHQKFVQFGTMKRKLVNQMLAILPDIYESGIWKKYAGTIYEYAGRFGGLGRSVVEKRLKLEKDLVNKPQLKEAIAEVGVHKVAMVAKLATPETDYAFADKIQNLSKAAVNVLAKELRQKDQIEIAMVCAAKPEIVTVELDEEMTFLFLRLKKKYGKNLSHRDAMRIILKKMDRIEYGDGVLKSGLEIRKNKKSAEDFPGQTRSEQSERSVSVGEIHGDNTKSNTAIVANNRQQQNAFCKGKNEIAAVDFPGKIRTEAEKYVETNDTGRYIAAQIRREVLSKTNGHCAYPNCNRPPENLHHRDRFSDSHSHESVVPLCKVHHEFMHNGLVKNELSEPQNWLMDLKNTVTNPIDRLYRKHRQEAMN